MSIDALMTKLFSWKNHITIEGVDFYLRVVSDHVIDDARREALLAARKLRRTLRDTDSDDYLIYLDPLADLEDDGLRNLIIVVAMREVMREYLNTNPRPIIEPLGDNPTQEEQETYEETKENREGEYLAEMESYVANWRTDFEAGLQKRPRDYLLNMAKANRVDQICEEKFSSVFEDYVVANSIYTDDKYKTRMFTLEQYKELPSDIRLKLRDAYNSLSVSPEQIKN